MLGAALFRHDLWPDVSSQGGLDGGSAAVRRAESEDRPGRETRRQPVLASAPAVCGGGSGTGFTVLLTTAVWTSTPPAVDVQVDRVKGLPFA